MILIKSVHQDISTVMVGEWLLYLGGSFTVINDGDLISNIQYSTQENFIFKTTSGKHINLKSVSSYWYRRGSWMFDFSQVQLKKVPALFGNSVRDEWSKLYNLLMLHLKKRNSIGSDLTDELNKLEVLEIANQVGLAIPKSLVTSLKSEVLSFFGNTSIISKTISEVILTEIEGIAYTNRTTGIDSNALPESFFPSLFQENIEKRYELRVFILNQVCYSMAIFSQTDEQTKVDFRNYNYRQPNRNVPFQLPLHIETKLLKLMEHLGLSTGSIDLIVNNSLEYIFLEVNPDGQFGMVSSPCNYNLEKVIASQLMNSNELRR
ncbi:hypothetical protein BH11BAC2_BH11BAC2_25050 [soil metagenome]